MQTNRVKSEDFSKHYIIGDALWVKDGKNLEYVV